MSVSPADGVDDGADAAPAAGDPARQRSGADTRLAIQRTALELFTERGVEATSLREIAEALGIRKASLYYHFRGKDEILRSLVDDRAREAEELLAWVRSQPASPETVRVAVSRWVGSASADKLRGIRLLGANPLLTRGATRRSGADDTAAGEAGAGGERIGSALAALVDALAAALPDRSSTRVLRLRMALLSINAAVDAAARGAFTDHEIVATARAHATAMLDDLLGEDPPPTSPAQAPAAPDS